MVLGAPWPLPVMGLTSRASALPAFGLYVNGIVKHLLLFSLFLASFARFRTGEVHPCRCGRALHGCIILHSGAAPAFPYPSC